MLQSAASEPAAVIFAHPVAGHPHVDVPLALTAGACALLVLAAALAAPGRGARPGDVAAQVWSWQGRLSRGQVVTRTLAVLLLLTAAVAGRVGVDDELENLAPALIIGLAPPVLVTAALLFGPVWRWVDPWDAVSRLISGKEKEQGPDSRPTNVWPAVVVAVPLLWYFSAYLDALSPRAVGTATALYSIVTVAGCLAFGRARWLSSAEPIGITLTWVGLLPRRRLADWQPPRGAEALLGAVIGGVLFGLVRRSEPWVDLTSGPRFTLYTSVGLVLVCVASGALLALMALAADLVGTRPGVARAAVPAVAGVVVAVALARDRFLISAQLLPGLLGDPLGAGWDLFGPAVDGLDADPLSARTLLFVQLGLLVLALLVAAFLAVARVEDRVRRVPIGIALFYLTAASVAAVAVH